MTNSLEQVIATLRSADLASVEIDDILHQLEPYMAGATLQAPKFSPGMLLFRGRLCERVNSVKELSYPPPELTHIGRLNRPGRPLFYASPSRTAVFYELTIQEGSFVLISRWRTKAPLLLNHVGYHANVFEKLGSRRTIAGWDGKTNPHSLQSESEPVWNNLGQLFTEQIPEGQEFRYKLSIAVAECMFGDLFGGVLYPSVAMWANADNVALRPTWVDANLSFVGVEAIRVRSIEGTKLHIDVVDYATSTDHTSLNWKGRGPIWQLKKPGAALRIESTGEIWRAFDEAGVEVDPQ